MGFWASAIATALIVGALMVLALLRGRPQGAVAAQDVDVYRDQLREVERDLARGVLGETEAERTRTEVARRLLEADKAAQAGGTTNDAPRKMTLVAAGLCLVVLIGGTGGLYRHLGAPGVADLPLEARKAAAEQRHNERPDQATAEIEAAKLPAPELPDPDPRLLDLVAQLREVVAERGGDVQGLEMLVLHEARLGNFTAAYQAQTRLIIAKGDAASAEDFATLGDLLVTAAGGYVSPEAERALTEALARDPRHKLARYYLGLMYAQVDRPDLAFRLWRVLWTESTAQDPWVGVLEAELPLLAQMAGVRFTLPPLAGTALRGPEAADIEAAGQMSAEDRSAMIRGMVDGLSARLANEGGSAEEWAQLIGALGVLGETERAAAIWAEAQQVFATDPQSLDTLRAAAGRAGVAE